MGLQGSKPIPISPDCIATIGITKTTESDVLYTEAKHQPALLASALLLSPAYRLYTVTHDERDIPQGLTSFMHYAKYHHVILEPIQQLISQANNKKQQLSKIAFHLPFFSCLQQAIYLTKRSVRQVMHSSLRLCWQWRRLSYCISLPLCILVLLIGGIGCLMAIIVDVLRCRHCCRDGHTDLDVMANVLITHPELDSKCIDDDLRRGLDELVARLQIYYPEYYIFLHTYQQDQSSSQCCPSETNPVQLIHWMVCFVDRQSPTAEEAGILPGTKLTLSSSSILESPPSPSRKKTIAMV